MSAYFSLTRILGPAVGAEIERASPCRPTAESELGLFGALSSTKVQDEVVKFTRACAYSHAGIIRSEDKDGSRDGEGVAWGLHAALTAAGESGPLVMMGPSGGTYGNEVSGSIRAFRGRARKVTRRSYAG
jgi:hypothetical protein